MTGMTEVPAVVRETAVRFGRKYRVRDVEELESEARYHYVLASRAFDPSRGTAYTGYLGYCIWKRLVISHRQARRQARLLRRVVRADTGAVAGDFDREGLESGLRADAGFVVRLVLDSSEFAAKVHHNVPAGRTARAGAGQFRSRTHVRKLVKAHLRELGWSAFRIHRAFAEVREAL